MLSSVHGTSSPIFGNTAYLGGGGGGGHPDFCVKLDFEVAIDQ